ncbi:MAG: hypothetical protein J6D36_06850, partial [Erysipelotrichaceae bacterium]|nr:hypothetical protein [Erysipelotrichaceae bacterium]
MEKKSIAVLLSLLLLFPLFPQAAYAGNFDGKITNSGTYTFASNERDDINLTDTYEYRDDCFRIAAPEGCCHLA